MKQMGIALSILLAVGSLVTVLGCSNRAPDNLGNELQSLASGLVERDKSVKNCVLSVTKGDGSFSWSGAAGVARQDGAVPMTKDTPIYIASITKLYTATAIMRLNEMGALSLDDPMAKYLPEEIIRGIHVYKGRDFSQEITIRQLLSHSSGIADYYSEKGKDGKSLFDSFLENPGRSWTVDQTIERARRDLTPNFAPGMGTSYSDTNFQLLGKVIEAITGKPLEVVYETFFCTPLGLKHTWLVGHSQGKMGTPADVFYKDMNIDMVRSNGSYWADGGIVSTAQEMIVFLKALNDGRIIRRDSLSLMHGWRKWHFPLDYGYGTMRFRLPRVVSAIMKVGPLWGHSGSTGSFLYYSEDLDLYMAGTIDQTESQSKPFLLLMRAIRLIQSKPARSLG
ncbi:MAG: serine hydrolase domain-containing protein [Spirochaetia bacterium]|jgi:CubicO group peptidase (beta-lactamase class C family)